MHTGLLIRRRRSKLGLTQAKLAEIIRVSAKAVSKRERGSAVQDTDNNAHAYTGLTISQRSLPKC